MHLEIIHITQKIFQKASDFFGEDFCKTLKKEKPGTFRESLVARYFIKTSSLSPLLAGKGDKTSISHKKDLVFIGLSTEDIGVDIEIVKERGIELLEKFSNEEYEILGSKNIERQRAKVLCGQNDKWIYFYTLWTAKEAIIKYENLLLDDMEEIILINVEMFGKNISGIKFQNKLILKYKKKKFVVYCGQEKNMIFSICISTKVG